MRSLDSGKTGNIFTPHKVKKRYLRQVEIGKKRPSSKKWRKETSEFIGGKVMQLFCHSKLCRQMINKAIKGEKYLRSAQKLQNHNLSRIGLFIYHLYCTNRCDGKLRVNGWTLLGTQRKVKRHFGELIFIFHRDRTQKRHYFRYFD